MELDRVADKGERLFTRLTSGYAPWEIRDVGAERGGTFFDDNEVSHATLLLLQTRLLQHAGESTGWDVNSRIPRDRYGSSLQRMLKLAMTALGPNENPAVRFDQRDQLADLH